MLYYQGNKEKGYEYLEQAIENDVKRRTIGIKYDKSALWLQHFTDIPEVGQA